ncbi:DUF3299 domain-containing protein [Pseudoroseicyclus tamaricis]|uniref:DUF3299 domain-containing protein n=1 Tax=Pseudoroseicyclus tamaricis TaxID=2705421 RepID=A0A6B2JRC0_9RHOB|nr:DUF3299 domain-containing protein [Pseudoroseicyclus tamaricis]NDV01117.1 DUF3299 domain-containing protein [Pseudoroseicyclus tamaricis]
MVNRRTLLAALPAALIARPLLAAPVELSWEDLVPPGGAVAPDLSGVIEHDEASSLAAQQPLSSGVRDDWNGETVRIAGFMIPLDYSGTGVTAFMLVPYVGACIHVPPPPANQLILVTTERPYESDGLFEPIVVTGMFGSASVSTQLADVGYALSADKVEPYQG